MMGRSTVRLAIRQRRTGRRQPGEPNPRFIPSASTDGCLALFDDGNAGSLNPHEP